MIVPPSVGSSSGMVREQRIEAHVRHARIEQAAEALDEAEHLDLALVGADHRAVQGGVEGRRVAAGRQDADAFHTRPARRTHKEVKGAIPVGTVPVIPATSPDGRPLSNGHTDSGREAPPIAKTVKPGCGHRSFAQRAVMPTPATAVGIRRDDFRTFEPGMARALYKSRIGRPLRCWHGDRRR